MNVLIAIVLPILLVSQVPADKPAAALDEASAKSVVDPAVDAVLTRLEKRSDGITDIRCKVRFKEIDEINKSERIKIGSLSFLITEPNPHWMVHFEKTQVDGVLGKREWYLFDGYWMHEAHERTEKVTSREFARAGEKVDFFDIERTPFPLPFGQKKEKILKNFDVTLVPPAKGDLADSDHLVCVTKADSPLVRRYTKLEFFIIRGLDLPARVIATQGKGLETIQADFPDLSKKSLNAGLTKKDFAHPKEWKKYKRIEEPLE